MRRTKWYIDMRNQTVGFTVTVDATVEHVASYGCLFSFVLIANNTAYCLIVKYKFK